MSNLNTKPSAPPLYSNIPSEPVVGIPYYEDTHIREPNDNIVFQTNAYVTNPVVEHPFNRNNNESNYYYGKNWGVCRDCGFQFIRCEKDKNSPSYFRCEECLKTFNKRRCCASCTIS